jgi:hypothetical protein
MNMRKAIAAIPKPVRTAIAVLIVGLSFLYIGRNIVRGLNQVDLASLELQPGPAILAVVLYTVASLIGAWCWSLIMSGLGQKLPLRTNLKIHLTANVVKYLPGYGWQILGKAYLCSRQGMSTWLVGVAITLEFLCVGLTGAWAAVLTVPAAWLETWGIGQFSAWRLPILVALSAVLVGLPRLLRQGLRSRQASQRVPEVTIQAEPLWLMLVLMVVAWFVLGLTLYMLTTALYPLQAADLPAMTFSWAVSSLLSLAVVVVPMGIGVKEGAMAFLLGLRLPLSIASVVAVLARVVAIGSEALCFWIGQRLR